DHDKIFFFTVIYRLLICLKPRNAELFVHGDLRFHSGDQIVNSVYDSLIVLPDSLRSAFQSLPVFPKSFLFDVFGDIAEHGIQSHNDRRIGLTDFLDQFIYHDYFLLKMIYLLTSGVYFILHLAVQNPFMNIIHELTVLIKHFLILLKKYLFIFYGKPRRIALTTRRMRAIIKSQSATLLIYKITSF